MHYDDQEPANDIFKGSSNSGREKRIRQEQQDREKETPFLDKAFFDPNDYDENDLSFFGKIASFVKADYELFEAVFVSCFFLILITIAKDLLRAQMDFNSVSSPF